MTRTIPPRPFRDRPRAVAWLAAALLGLVIGPLGAPQAGAQTTEVDLELVLLVDVSRSMTENELELQRRGYAEALRSDEVFAALQDGMLQSIALTYVEWAGTQEIVVDWQLVETRADLDAFAGQLTASFNPAMRRTSISNALEFATRRIEENSFDGLRRVIDISGDGPNNLGPLVTLARDETISRGITVNGLPLMTNEGTGAMFHLDRLDLYYQSCVIGGSGAFMIPVYVWPDFATAVKRKLVLEIAGLPAQETIYRAQAVARDPTDCSIGEKIWREWRQNGYDFYNP